MRLVDPRDDDRESLGRRDDHGENVVEVDGLPLVVGVPDGLEVVVVDHRDEEAEGLEGCLLDVTQDCMRRRRDGCPRYSQDWR